MDCVKRVPRRSLRGGESNKDGDVDDEHDGEDSAVDGEKVPAKVTIRA